MRLDLSHIQRWIDPGSRVLDLGCGDGVFLESLRDQRQVRGTGLEIDQGVHHCRHRPRHQCSRAKYGREPR